MEDVMVARTPWSDTGQRTRRLLITAAVGEAILRAAVLIDFKRRPAASNG